MMKNVQVVNVYQTIPSFHLIMSNIFQELPDFIPYQNLIMWIIAKKNNDP